MRFLVVDSNGKTCKQAVAQLHEIGTFSRPLEAANGTAALAILRSQAVDFVIASWTLSDMSGPELARRIRMDAGLRRLHILLVAAEAKRDNALEAAQSGANDLILRPFSADALEKKIARIGTLARMLAHRSREAVIGAVQAHVPPPVEHRAC